MDEQAFHGNDFPSDNEREEDFLSDNEREEAYLSEETNKIVRLVLPRLPARTLLRFRSVSPNFNAMISSPFMVLSHFLHPKSFSGLFYHTGSDIRYFSFEPPYSDLPDPTLSYLPEPVTIKASTRGLLCVRGENKYYITNPTTMKWVDLPEPPNKHRDDVAVVVVFDEPALFNFTGKYRVVCANPVIDGFYGFETFSSDEWAWTPLDQYHDGGNIVTGSGTAVGAVAYWRMTMGTALTVLSYDPVTNTSSITQKPHPEMLENWWELGEVDGQLSVTSRSTEGEIPVNTSETTNEGGTPYLEEKRSFWVSEWVHAPPIRSQDSAISVMWPNEMLVLRDMQGAIVSPFDMPDYYTGFVPYISTLVTVRSSNAGMSSEPSSVINNDIILRETQET